MKKNLVRKSISFNTDDAVQRNNLAWYVSQVGEISIHIIQQLIAQHIAETGWTASKEAVAEVQRITGSTGAQTTKSAPPTEKQSSEYDDDDEERLSFKL